MLLRVFSLLISIGDASGTSSALESARAVVVRVERDAEVAESITGLGVSKIGKMSKILQIFGGLVLGCIKTKFCKKICV